MLILIQIFKTEFCLSGTVSSLFFSTPTNEYSELISSLENSINFKNSDNTSSSIVNFRLTPTTLIYSTTSPTKHTPTSSHYALPSTRSLISILNQTLSYRRDTLFMPSLSITIYPEFALINTPTKTPKMLEPTPTLLPSSIKDTPTLVQHLFGSTPKLQYTLSSYKLPDTPQFNLIPSRPTPTLNIRNTPITTISIYLKETPQMNLVSESTQSILNLQTLVIQTTQLPDTIYFTLPTTPLINITPAPTSGTPNNSFVNNLQTPTFSSIDIQKTVTFSSPAISINYFNQTPIDQLLNNLSTICSQNLYTIFTVSNIYEYNNNENGLNGTPSGKFVNNVSTINYKNLNTPYTVSNIYNKDTLSSSTFSTVKQETSTQISPTSTVLNTVPLSNLTSSSYNLFSQVSLGILNPTPLYSLKNNAISQQNLNTVSIFLYAPTNHGSPDKTPPNNLPHTKTNVFFTVSNTTIN